MRGGKAPSPAGSGARYAAMAPSYSEVWAYTFAASDRRSATAASPSPASSARTTPA